MKHKTWEREKWWQAEWKGPQAMAQKRKKKGVGVEGLIGGSPSVPDFPSVVYQEVPVWYDAVSVTHKTVPQGSWQTSPTKATWFDMMVGTKEGTGVEEKGKGEGGGWQDPEFEAWCEMVGQDPKEEKREWSEEDYQMVKRVRCELCREKGVELWTEEVEEDTGMGSTVSAYLAMTRHLRTVHQVVGIVVRATMVRNWIRDQAKELGMAFIGTMDMGKVERKLGEVERKLVAQAWPPPASQGLGGEGKKLGQGAVESLERMGMGLEAMACPLCYGKVLKKGEGGLVNVALGMKTHQMMAHGTGGVDAERVVRGWIKEGVGVGVKDLEPPDLGWWKEMNATQAGRDRYLEQWDADADVEYAWGKSVTRMDGTKHARLWGNESYDAALGVGSGLKACYLGTGTAHGWHGGPTMAIGEGTHVCEAHRRVLVRDPRYAATYGRVHRVVSRRSVEEVRVLGERLIPKGEGYRTQKARGVWALGAFGWDVPEAHIETIERVEERLGEKSGAQEWVGQFVRPCPVRPRHGFVESRVVKSEEELRGLVRETREADSLAEMIRMPVVEAVCGGVWTEGRLSVGQGRDGATAGREAITLPAVGDLLKDRGLGGWLRKEAGVVDAPYVELLWRKTNAVEQVREGYQHATPTWKTLAVQLRNGPKLEGMEEDWVPGKWRVQEVVRVEGQDLLQWEREIAAVRARGAVVWHPGGSLASHYAVHAVLAGVPVMVSREPKVGEELEPVGLERKGVRLEELRRGFRQGLDQEMSYMDAGWAMLAAAHHAGVWAGRADRALGFGMGCGFRLLVTACLGEDRHHGQSTSKGMARERVYGKAWEKAGEGDTLRLLQAALDHFLNSGNWPSGGHGGFKWYEFALWGVELWETLRTGEVQGDEEQKREAKAKGWGAGEQAINWLNGMVNAAHNNGWAFNKFLGAQEMDQAAQLPVRVLVKAGADMWRALTAQEKETRWDLRVGLDGLGRHRTKKERVQCTVCYQWGHKTKECTQASCSECGMAYKKEEGHADCPAMCKTCTALGRTPLQMALAGEKCPECMAEETGMGLGIKHTKAKFGPAVERGWVGGVLCRLCELPYAQHHGGRCVWKSDGHTMDWYKKTYGDAGDLSAEAMKKFRRGKVRWWEPGAWDAYRKKKVNEMPLSQHYLLAEEDLKLLDPMSPVAQKGEGVIKPKPLLKPLGALTPVGALTQPPLKPLGMESMLEKAMLTPLQPSQQPMVQVGKKMVQVGEVTEAQACLRGTGVGALVHVQYRAKGKGGSYATKDVSLAGMGTEGEWEEWCAGRTMEFSMAGGQTKYWELEKREDGWYVMGKKVLGTMMGEGGKG